VWTLRSNCFSKRKANSSFWSTGIPSALITWELERVVSFTLREVYRRDYMPWHQMNRRSGAQSRSEHFWKEKKSWPSWVSNRDSTVLQSVEQSLHQLRYSSHHVLMTANPELKWLKWPLFTSSLTEMAYISFVNIFGEGGGRETGGGVSLLLVR